MSILAPAAPRLFGVKFDGRGEFRRALLAASETCWVYAIVLTVSAMTRQAERISPFAIFLVYWAAIQIGRYLPRVRRGRSSLEWINLALAIVLVLIVVRVDLYRDVPPLDFTWLPRYLARLSALFQTFTPEHIATFALVFVYVRGLGFAHRPLTLWFTGFQFRLGVVFFFAAAIVGAFAGGVDLRGVIIVYFLVSLLSIALARMEESGREMSLGKAWGLLLVGASLLVVGLGFFITPLLTISAAAAFFLLLAPFGPALQFVVSLIMVPLGYILEAIFNFLIPIFSVVVTSLGRLPLGVFSQLAQPLQKATDQGAYTFLIIWPYLRLVLFLAVIMGAALLVARALNYRMAQAEQESFVRETVGEPDRKRAEKMTRLRAAPPGQREIEAENIRRIYAALLARCQSIGLARREAETPFEFLPRLEAQFPGAAPDLEALTEAYVAVHYAQIPSSPAQVRAMRSAWQRLRGQLKPIGGGGRKVNSG